MPLSKRERALLSSTTSATKCNTDLDVVSLGHIHGLPSGNPWIANPWCSAPCSPVQGRRWAASLPPPLRRMPGSPARQLGSSPPGLRPAPGALFQGGLRGRMQTTMLPPSLRAWLLGIPWRPRGTTAAWGQPPTAVAGHWALPTHSPEGGAHARLRPRTLLGEQRALRPQALIGPLPVQGR